MKMNNNQRGISLVALIITVIVLIILGGVSISTLTKKDGLINNTNYAKVAHTYYEAEQRVKLAYSTVMEEIMTKVAYDKYYNPTTESETTKLANVVKKDLGITSVDSNGTWTVDSSTAGVIKITYTDDKIVEGVMGEATITKLGDTTDTVAIPREEGVVHYQINLLEEQDAKLYVDTADDVGGVSVQIKDVSGTIQNVKKADVANWYGKEVKNYKAGATYRIFYIDFDGKYGDSGTIYLKADYSDSLNGALSTSTPDSTTKVIDMNPGWAEGATSSTPPTKRKNIASSSWNRNEKAAAYLCTPVTSTSGSSLPWASYYESGKSDFVIGSPSVEMYCDSYNQVPHTGTGVVGNYTLGASYRATSYPGYIYTLDGNQSTISNSDYYTGTDTLDYTQYGSMYCGVEGAKVSKYWWLASPSSSDGDLVCYVSCYSARLDYYSYGTSIGLCPLVSLNSSFIPSLQTQS